MSVVLTVSKLVQLLVKLVRYWYWYFETDEATGHRIKKHTLSTKMILVWYQPELNLLLPVFNEDFCSRLRLKVHLERTH